MNNTREAITGISGFIIANTLRNPVYNVDWVTSCNYNQLSTAGAYSDAFTSNVHATASCAVLMFGGTRRK